VVTQPVLAPIADQVINEGTLLSLDLSGGNPTTGLTFSVVTGPSGLTVDPNSGLLTWTPTEAQGPSTNVVTVQVASSASPSSSTTRGFTITVNEVNSPPALALIPNQTVAEGGTLVLSLTATDSDLPPNHLTYSLVSGPAGTSVDAQTGLLSWTPAPGQGANVITVRVTDDGTPPLSDTKTFRVTVTQQLPTDLQVAALGTPATVAFGDTYQYFLLVTNRGPSAAAGVVVTDQTPPGVTVTAASATQGTWIMGSTKTVFTMGYLAAGASATVTLTLKATVGGTLTNTAAVTSAVPDLDTANNTLEEHTQVTGSAPALKLSFGGGQVSIVWPSAAVGFHLEYAESLGAGAVWSASSTVPVLVGNAMRANEAIGSGQRFYRLSNR
jgi:uncharacterized repeat protein (TIGR01451 family)